MLACLAECVAIVVGHAVSLDRFTEHATLLADRAPSDGLADPTRYTADVGLGGGRTCDPSAYTLELYWHRSPHPKRYGLYARATICSTELGVDLAQLSLGADPPVNAQLTQGVHLAVGNRSRLFAESHVALLSPPTRLAPAPTTLTFGYSVAVTASLRLIAQVYMQLSVADARWPAGGGSSLALSRRSSRASDLRREEALD